MSYSEIKTKTLNYLHKQYIEAYKRNYRKKNKKDPSPALINTYVQHLITNGNLEKEAEDLVAILIGFTEAPRKQNILINKVITLPAAALIVLLLLILFNGSVPSLILQGPVKITLITTGVVVLLFIVVYSVISIMNKKD